MLKKGRFDKILQKLKKKYYPINQYIKAEKVRVIDEAGKQIGIFPLNQALLLAREKKLDLVEVAQNANPPVCKIIDFKKFKYLEAKKEQQEKRKVKKVETKEVRLTPFIAENDFRFRMKRAEEFLKEGNRVKLKIFFKGRTITKKDFGYNLLKKANEYLSSFSQSEDEPKFIGSILEMTFSPIKGSKNVT